jgi:hypothetical protein
MLQRVDTHTIYEYLKLKIDKSIIVFQVYIIDRKIRRPILPSNRLVRSWVRK